MIRLNHTGRRAMAQQVTWNIAEVERVEGRHRLAQRFVRLAWLWALAFLVVVVGSLVGLNAAEAGTALEFGSIGLASPMISGVLLGLVIGASGSCALVLGRHDETRRQLARTRCQPPSRP